MILEVKALRKNFSTKENSEVAPESSDILTGVNLSVKANETVAILGESGSGKSTLLSLLAGLDQPSSGEVWLGGKNLQELNEEALTRYRAKQLSLIFQSFHLLPHLNALENVALPLQLQEKARAPQESARAALESVGLGHRLTHFPHQLSGGEKQRIAIARAFAVKPLLLLADEPTGNLDQDTSQKVMNLLFNLVEEKQMTLILVTHDRKLAQRCATIYEMTQGNLKCLKTANKKVRRSHTLKTSGTGGLKKTLKKYPKKTKRK